LVTVEHVTRTFGRVVAENDVSFELGEGEIVGFLGPNGSGKTTLLRVMSTFLLPTSGTATVDGVDVVSDPLEVRRRIGYLPENNILYEQRRGGSFLDFVARARGLEGGRLRERLDWCVESLKLAEVMGKRNMECSRGFRQRISLAAALVHDPRTILLDEPTNGLDPLQILAFRDFLRSLAKERTILFSSHILQEVASITERVLIISEGALIGDITFREKDNRTERLEKIFVETLAKKRGKKNE